VCVCICMQKNEKKRRRKEEELSLSQSSYCLGHKQLHKEIWDRGYSGALGNRSASTGLEIQKKNNRIRKEKGKGLTKPQSNLMVSELRRRKKRRRSVTVTVGERRELPLRSRRCRRALRSSRPAYRARVWIPCPPATLQIP